MCKQKNNKFGKGNYGSKRYDKDQDPWTSIKEVAAKDDHLKNVGYVSEFVEQTTVVIKLSVLDKDGNQINATEEAVSRAAVEELAALNPVTTRSTASVENDAVRSIKEEMVRTKYSTAVKLLMQEGQKAMNSRIETIRYIHEQLVKVKEHHMYNVFNTKHPNVIGTHDVVDYSKKLQAVFYGVEGMSKTDREESCRIRLEKWKSQKASDMASLQGEIKRLENLNKIIVLLGCTDECQVTDEKAVILLCKKLSGNLKQIGDNIMSQIKDRDDLMEDADPAELEQIKVQYKRLPKNPDELYTRVQFLSPKIEEAELGHGGRDTLYMSFAAKATKAYKKKNAIENMEQWCDECKRHGHKKDSWRCPKSNTKLPKKEFKKMVATLFTPNEDS